MKFNFQIHGTSVENPSDFADLESFVQNNYSKELSDLNFVIEAFSKDNRVDAENITLIGHSRGGEFIVSASENLKSKPHHICKCRHIE